ncbi:MAG TPA: hypothetical protein DD417_00190 [Elusimicrobia bacterium]|nr:hypothetical protein [Elusimicrobiota bacterium]
MQRSMSRGSRVFWQSLAENSAQGCSGGAGSSAAAGAAASAAAGAAGPAGTGGCAGRRAGWADRNQRARKWLRPISQKNMGGI